MQSGGGWGGGRSPDPSAPSSAEGGRTIPLPPALPICEPIFFINVKKKSKTPPLRAMTLEFVLCG